MRQPGQGHIDGHQRQHQAAGGQRGHRRGQPEPAASARRRQRGWFGHEVPSVTGRHGTPHPRSLIHTETWAGSSTGRPLGKPTASGAP